VAARAAIRALAAAEAVERGALARLAVGGDEWDACWMCGDKFLGHDNFECAQCCTVAYGSAGSKSADWVRAGGHRAVCRVDGAAKLAREIARAEAGDADGMYRVGLFFEKGTGVAADAREAVEWYSRAAEAGHAGAQNNLE